jgi:hypothetical protein
MNAPVVHLSRPDLVLPRELEYVAGMDWGINEPGCIVWTACLPMHRLHVLREWKFTGLADEEIAEGYLARTKDLKVHVRYVAGDPSMWIRDGRNARRGQSRAETLIRAGMPLRKAENAREDGWSRLHSLLRIPRNDDGAVTGEPLLTIDEACAYLRRTIPAAQSDKLNADDVNTRGDDHGLDALRYMAMSRPAPTTRWQEPRPPKGTMGYLLDELRGQASRHAVLGAGNVRGAS